MEKVLCLAHTESDGNLNKASLEALTAAKELAAALDGATLTVGLVGVSLDTAVSQIGGCEAASVLVVSGEAFAEGRYASDAAAVEAICTKADASLVVAAGTSRWSRVMGGVSLRLGAKIDSHVSSISVDGGAVKASRWFYRQRMEGQLSRSGRPWVLLVDPGNASPFQSSGASVEVQQVSVDLSDSAIRSSVEGVREPEAGEQTINPDAQMLFVAGAGWTKKQADGEIHTGKAGELIMGLLRNSSASLGSSKSLVDMEGEGQGVLPFLSHMNQVGQTGSTPRHPKGLATCCHGEEPHVVGWRFVNERRAVNLDPNCGWAQGKADVLYVADAFEVMEKVNELLAKT